MKTEIQRICVKAKPTVSNPDYYDWQTASIVMLIPENNKLIALKKARSELQKRHWEFINYEDKSTLIEERVKEVGRDIWKAYLSAKKGNIFFRKATPIKHDASQFGHISLINFCLYFKFLSLL